MRINSHLNIFSVICKEDIMTKNLTDFYTENLGNMTPSIYSDIECLLNGGINEDLIMLAINKSKKIKNWAYSRKILLNWANQNIKSQLDLNIKMGLHSAPKDYIIGDEPW